MQAVVWTASITGQQCSTNVLISRCFLKRHERVESKTVLSTQTVVAVNFSIHVPREQYPSHAFPSAVISPFSLEFHPISNWFLRVRCQKSSRSHCVRPSKWILRSACKIVVVTVRDVIVPVGLDGSIVEKNAKKKNWNYCDSWLKLDSRNRTLNVKNSVEHQESHGLLCWCIYS